MREVVVYLLSLVIGVPLLVGADINMKLKSISFMLRARSVHIGQSREQVEAVLSPFHRKEEFPKAQPPFVAWYAGLGVSYKDARVQAEFGTDGRAVVVEKIWGSHF